MTTNYPTSLDALTNPASADTLDSPPHSNQHANANDAIEALQTKVGVDGSSVATSLDYLAKKGTALVATTAPSSPVTNQLWYDSTNKILKRWTGTVWETSGSAAYLPIDGGPAVWIAAPSFQAVTGVPSQTTQALRHAAWLLDSAATERLASSWDMPADWSSVNVDFYWTNAGAGTGDVRWQLFTDNAADGATIDASGTSSHATVTAPAQDVLKVSRVGAAIALTASNYQNCRIGRVGGDAADTLANDVALLGVLISKAS